jgi:hypothetical protein
MARFSLIFITALLLSATEAAGQAASPTIASFSYSNGPCAIQNLGCRRLPISTGIYSRAQMTLAANIVDDSFSGGSLLVTAGDNNVLLRASNLSGTWDLPTSLDQASRYFVTLQGTFSYVDHENHTGTGQLAGKIELFYSPKSSEWRAYMLGGEVTLQ